MSSGCWGVLLKDKCTQTQTHDPLMAEVLNDDDWSSRTFCSAWSSCVKQSDWCSCSCSKPTVMRELCWDPCWMCQVFRWQRGRESEEEQIAAEHLINLSLTMCAPEWKVHSRLDSSVVHVLQSSGGCPLKDCLIIYTDGWILYTTSTAAWEGNCVSGSVCLITFPHVLPSGWIWTPRDLLKRAELVNFLKYFFSVLIYEWM